MLYRVLIPLLFTASIFASCEENDDGFHKDPRIGFITVYGPSIGEPDNCPLIGYAFEEPYTIQVRDSVGHPISGVPVKVTTDQCLVLLDPADSVGITDDSGVVDIEIGSDCHGEGFWFLVTAAGDTELFELNILGDIGFPTMGYVEAEADTLYVHSEELDSLQIQATLRNGFGEALPGSYVWFSASAGRIDTSAQVFESYRDSIFWYPPEPAILDDVFVYARFGVWCRSLHDSILVTLNDTTSFIVFPTP